MSEKKISEKLINEVELITSLSTTILLAEVDRRRSVVIAECVSDITKSLRKLKILGEYVRSESVLDYVLDEVYLDEEGRILMRERKLK